MVVCRSGPCLRGTGGGGGAGQSGCSGEPKAGGDILEQDTARHAEKSEAGNVRRRRRNPCSAGNGGGILTTDSRTAGEYRCCHQYVNRLASWRLMTYAQMQLESKIPERRSFDVTSLWESNAPRGSANRHVARYVGVKGKELTALPSLSISLNRTGLYSFRRQISTVRLAGG